MRTQTRAVFGAPIVTPREVWLAGLGAVVVTREWAGKEAGPLFRNLVKEGTIVETRAVRMVGDGIETGFERANTLWRRARTMVTIRSSCGCRRLSSAERGYSSSSSRNSTPLWARDTSPGFGVFPPPINPTSEMV